MIIWKKAVHWIKMWQAQFSLKYLKNNHCDDSREILVIKVDAIGDFIIWLDSAKEYRSIYPENRLTLLCTKTCGCIAEHTHYFDEIRILDMKRFESDAGYRNLQTRKMKEWQYGTLIQTAYSRTMYMDRIAATIAAHRKIGFQSDESRSNLSRYLLTRKNKKRLDQIYDTLIPASPHIMMELRRNEEFIRGLGKKKFVSSTPELTETEGVKEYSKDYFVIFPGASSGIKMWKTENFAKIINHIQNQTEWDALICGGKEEEYLYDRLLGKVKNRQRIQNYLGKTSLMELAEVIRHAKFVISNDTSGIHYAAATGVPAICVFGEYNYGRFLPYECGNKKDKITVCCANVPCRNCADRHMTITCRLHIFRTGRYRCLDMVSAEEVNSTIDQMMGNYRLIEEGIHESPIYSHHSVL